MFDATSLRGMVNTLVVDATALNREAAQAAMVRTATQARDRVLGGTPKPSGYRQIVDTVEGAPLTRVRADGTIIFAWQYLGEVVARVYDLLFQASPVLTGAYARGIQAQIGGERVSPYEIPSQARAVTIVATVPYARRLEVGRRKDGSRFSVQVPLHNVEQTAIVARRLFGDLATIRFTYVDLPDAYTLRTAFHGRRRRPDESGDVRYPAILIEAKQA